MASIGTVPGAWTAARSQVPRDRGWMPDSVGPLKVPKRAMPGCPAITSSAGYGAAACAASLWGSTKKLAPASGSSPVGAAGRPSGFSAISRASWRVVVDDRQHRLDGRQAMPIGDGPNSETCIVFGSPLHAVVDDRHRERRARLAGGEVEHRLDRRVVVGGDRGEPRDRDVADLRVLAGVGALDRDHGLAGVLVHGQRRDSSRKPLGSDDGVGDARPARSAAARRAARRRSDHQARRRRIVIQCRLRASRA